MTLLGLPWVTGAARAQAASEQAFEEPVAEGAVREMPDYELSLRLRFSYAERSDFRRLVFLFQQPLERVAVRELEQRLGLRLGVTPALYLRFELPLSWRHATVETDGLVVSPDQVIAGVERGIGAYGLSDPTLALGLVPLSGGGASLRVELGTTLAITDNPGSTNFPRNLPLSTGQNEIFGRFGPELALGAHHVGLHYTFGFFPQSAASYLVRRVGNQSYANGALGSRIRHRLELELELSLLDELRLSLRPDVQSAEQPSVVEYGSSYSVTGERFRTEVGLTSALLFELSEEHAIELSYRHLFLESWNEDPFFPIAIPDRGIAVSWRVLKQ